MCVQVAAPMIPQISKTSSYTEGSNTAQILKRDSYVAMISSVGTREENMFVCVNACHNWERVPSTVVYYH